MTQIDTGAVAPPGPASRRSRPSRTAPGAARLLTHLTVLEAERELHAKARFDTGGDIGDRAWRVEGESQLMQLDSQIRRLRRSLDDLDGPTEAIRRDRVGLGVTVALRFLGDSAVENYVVGDLDTQGDDWPVLTPDSPLGRVLIGAHVGDTVEYASPLGVTQVLVVAIG
jgi:transcription elongation factor GreA